jgi:hypothetical protein
VGIVVRADHVEAGLGITRWLGPHKLPGMRDPETVALPVGLDQTGLQAIQGAVRRSIARRRKDDAEEP